MSSTETSTSTTPDTSTTQQPPTLTIFSRVASIPLVNESLATIHAALVGSRYTSVPYVTAQNLGKSVYHISEPIQIRLAPVLIRADGLANKSLDAVQSYYPTPFTITSEEIRKEVNQRREHAYNTANKALDDRVRTPAYSAAQAIDQKFTPIVDIVEDAIKKLHTKNGDQANQSPAVDSKFQYQRAYALSRDLREQLARYSVEQFKQIESQNVLVNRASVTAQKIIETASSSYTLAQSKVHELSDTMLAELKKIQASTYQLPSQVQSSLRDVSDGLTTSIHELSGIVSSDAPINEKAGKVKDTVQQKVQPLLDAATCRVQEILGVISSRGQEAKETAEKKVQENAQNGSANGHTE